MKLGLNIVTRCLAAHPEHGRFDSCDLRKAFTRMALDSRYTIDPKRFGIPGVDVIFILTA